MSMTDLLSWGITAVVALILAGFVLYVVGLRAIPTDKRPTTPVYDRLGREIDVAENPDYHVNPGEESEKEPPGTPPSDTLQGGGREPGK